MRQLENSKDAIYVLSFIVGLCWNKKVSIIIDVRERDRDKVGLNGHALWYNMYQHINVKTSL